MAVAGLLVVAAVAVAKSARSASAEPASRATRSPSRSTRVASTIYQLGPETTRHLVCRSQACFAAWPPLKAKGAVTKMTGVTGKVGTIKRDGFTQVTLNGKPVYTFVEDAGRRGEAEGDGINNFGGVWHVVKEG